jgi:Ca2+/H+ antiporter, TMEM165/GDT1 family
MKTLWAGRIIKGIVLVAIAIAALGWVVMSLWNGLLPGLFGWPSVSFWQAIGLLLLSRLLFGGLRPGFGQQNKWRGHWREKMRARWAAMSDAEREQLRSGLRGRCGPWRSRSEQES